jgi:hypothetical protein
MEAIAACSDSLARAVLNALCHDPEIERKASQYLEKLIAASDSENKGVKRPAEELEICGQCKESFTEASNSAKACLYHDGM